MSAWERQAEKSVNERAREMGGGGGGSKQRSIPLLRACKTRQIKQI